MVAYLCYAALNETVFDLIDKLSQRLFIIRWIIMKNSKFMVAFLALLSMLSYIATDMYLPAFKDIEVGLSTGPEQIAFSLSVFLVGLAIGQFFWGVASDKYGQRVTLLLGLVLFTLSSLGLAFSFEVWHLLVLRFIQAIGVSAPAVIWQAYTIRKFSEKESQLIFATVMPLVALSPALAPQIGVVILNIFGWQSIFLSLTFLGVILCFASTKLERDTVSEKKISVLTDVKEILLNKQYSGNVLMYATSSATFFAYLTGIPEVMNQFGYDSKVIALSFVPQTIAFVMGGYICKRALKHFSNEIVLKCFIIIFSLSSLAVFFITQNIFYNILSLLIPFWIIAMANGAMYPIFVNRALSSVSAESPATAAGLQNSLVILISSIASGVVASYASQLLTVTGICVLVSLFTFLIGYITTEKFLSKYFRTPDVAYLCLRDKSKD